MTKMKVAKEGTMTVIKKPKTMKEALGKAKVSQKLDEGIFDQKKDVPSVIATLPKATVEKIRAAIENRIETIAEEANLKARLAEIEKQKKGLEAALRDAADNLDAMTDPDTEVEFTFAGANIKIGKQGSKRSLTDEGKKKLLEILNADDLFALANFKLGDLDDYLTAKQRDQVLETSRTTRGLTITPLTKDGEKA